MQGISLATESLDSEVKRVRDEIMEPYEAIRQKTLQLKNLQVGVLLSLILPMDEVLWETVGGKGFFTPAVSKFVRLCDGDLANV